MNLVRCLKMVKRGVFKIINKQTGKVHVCSSNTNLDNLMHNYWDKLFSGVHHNRKLQADFNYYDSSNFKWLSDCFDFNENNELTINNNAIEETLKKLLKQNILKKH